MGNVACFYCLESFIYNWDSIGLPQVRRQSVERTSDS